MPDGLKVIADVQELIKVRLLDSSFAAKLDASVRNRFLDLQKAVQSTRER